MLSLRNYSLYWVVLVPNYHIPPHQHDLVISRDINCPIHSKRPLWCVLPVQFPLGIICTPHPGVEKITFFLSQFYLPTEKSQSLRQP